jgi:tetratricopeptide (TPR) repeat protein
VWKARNEGRFQDAAALREQARAMVKVLPPDSEQFLASVQTVAQLYQESARTVQAREVVEEALNLAAGLGDTDPVRIRLLIQMAELWQQDGNPLKALPYLENAVRAEETVPPAVPKSEGARRVGVAISGVMTVMTSGGFARPGMHTDLTGLYQQLAETYRQLGRREAIDALTVKVRAFVQKQGDARLAWYFENYGVFEDAVAVFQRQAERGGDPQQVSNAWQGLAELYARARRFDEAVTAMQRAVAAAGRSQPWLQQSLVSILQRAGRLDQADSVYQEAFAASAQGAEGNHFSTMLGYANYLSGTKRGSQAEALLNEYRASHSLPPNQENSILWALGNAAQAAGDNNRAAEYQQRAAAGTPKAPRDPAQRTVMPDLESAQSAANSGRVDDAVRLALDAIDRSSGAVDRDQIVYLAPSVAMTLDPRKAGGPAQQIYDRLFRVVESWAVYEQQTLLTVTAQYARWLVSRPERWRDVPDALERYRNLETAAHGADSGSQTAVLRLAIDFERMRNGPVAEVRAAQDLVKFEGTLTGDTSEGYVSALATLAQAQERSGATDAALATYRRRIAIADAAFLPKNQQRGRTRVEAARAVARLGQFDEAERLIDEAVAIAKTWDQQAPYFDGERKQIERMKLDWARRAQARQDP